MEQEQNSSQETIQTRRRHPLRRGIEIATEAVGGGVGMGILGALFDSAVGISSPQVLVGEIMLGAILTPLLIAQAEGRSTSPSPM